MVFSILVTCLLGNVLILQGESRRLSHLRRRKAFVLQTVRLESVIRERPPGSLEIREGLQKVPFLREPLMVYHTSRRPLSQGTYCHVFTSTCVCWLDRSIVGPFSVGLPRALPAALDATLAVSRSLDSCKKWAPGKTVEFAASLCYARQ